MFVERFSTAQKISCSDRLTQALNAPKGRIYQASKRASNFFTSWIRSLCHPESRGLTAPALLLSSSRVATTRRSSSMLYSQRPGSACGLSHCGSRLIFPFHQGCCLACRGAVCCKLANAFTCSCKNSSCSCIASVRVALRFSSSASRRSRATMFVERFSTAQKISCSDRLTQALNAPKGRIYQASKRASNFFTSWIRSLCHPEGRGLTAPALFLSSSRVAATRRSSSMLYSQRSGSACGLSHCGSRLIFPFPKPQNAQVNRVPATSKSRSGIPFWLIGQLATYAPWLLNAIACRVHRSEPCVLRKNLYRS